MKSYTSEVFPDRKGIITSGLKAVSRNRQNVLKPIDFVATLLEGEVKFLEKGHAKRGGGRVRAFPHIAAAEQAGIRELEEGIKRGLEG